MYFLPATREMGVAFTDANTYSCDKQPVVLTWEDLVAPPPGSGDDDDNDADASQAPGHTHDRAGRGQGCG
jgi:hypothetical protein